MKKTLFIKRHLSVGGAETLLLRMSNWFIRNDFRVTILVEKKYPNEVSESLDLDESINILYLNSPFYNLCKLSYAKKIISDNDLEDVDIVYSFEPRELVASIAIARGMVLPRIMTGVYHPMAYQKYSKNIFVKYAANKIMAKFPYNNILFMNEAVRKSNEKVLNKEFLKCNIWPLPLSIPIYKKHEFKTKKIISVGNLKNFKTYNLTMLDVVAALIKKGYIISHHIYGEGSLRKEMEDKIKLMHLEEYVELHGQISYSEFQSTVQDGFVFVGVGTAVLEAASFGIPAICAVAFSDEAIAYGFVDNLPKNIVGEPIEGYKYYEIINLIEFLLTSSEVEYELVSKAGYSYVEKNYGCDNLMRKFVDLGYKADYVDRGEYNYFVYVYYYGSLIGSLFSKLRGMVHILSSRLRI